VLASLAMRTLKVIAVVLAATAGLACTHAGGKLMVDSPALTFQAPDIDEITGIDSEAADETPAPTPAPAAAQGAGSGSAASAQNPHK
jgi:hypothetical protein